MILLAVYVSHNVILVTHISRILARTSISRCLTLERFFMDNHPGATKRQHRRRTYLRPERDTEKDRGAQPPPSRLAHRCRRQSGRDSGHHAGRHEQHGPSRQGHGQSYGEYESRTGESLALSQIKHSLCYRG